MRSSFVFVLAAACSALFYSSVFAEEMTKDEIKSLSVMADSISQQKPRFAADCQYAYAMLEAFSNEDNRLVEVRGDDDVVANRAQFMKNVWGLVLYREAVREGKDPKSIHIPLKREIEKREFIRRMRMTSGPFQKIEKQLNKCVKKLPVGVK